jgi:hypothetical protein
MKMSGPTPGRQGAQTQADEIIEDSTLHGINPQDLGVNLSKVIGLSDWFDGNPPEPGWWNVRLPQDPNYANRRWWNGIVWSWAVDLGDDEAYIEEMRTRRSQFTFQYQGLRRPWSECRYAD